MRAKIYTFVAIISFLTTACDPAGEIYLENAYSNDVIVYVIYRHQGRSIDQHLKFTPGMVFAPDAMGHIEYRNIVSIRVEDIDGLLLSEYPFEYISRIRDAYKEKRNRHESWFFSEKGLFLGNSDINKKFSFNPEKITEYYRSEEAVKDLKSALKILGE
jgi:hypothetical protein